MFLEFCSHFNTLNVALFAVFHKGETASCQLTSLQGAVKNTGIMARYNKLLSAFVIVYWPVCTPSLFPTDGDGEN